MGQVRFVGNEAHAVPLLGREVQPDELIELPDAVIQAHEWPSAQWDVIDSGRKVYNPGDHTVAEVNAYLETADDDERARVLTVERDGQTRKGILDNVEGI